MIYIRKKEEVRISALLALFSIPISFLFMGVAVHVDATFQILYIPAFIVLELLKAIIGPPSEWFGLVVALLAQYIGSFLLILLSFKLLRKLKITGEPSPAKGDSQKNPPGP